MNPLQKEPASKSGILLVETSLLGVTVGVMSMGHDGAAPERSPKPALRAQQGHYENAGSIAMITPLVERCLETANIAPSQIEGVMVSTGPGSFTGIKIGLAFAYGWACGTKQPLRWLGVSALELAAAWRSQTQTGQSGQIDPIKQVRSLFLPATRTHGFMATARNGVAETAHLIDISAWEDASHSTTPDMTQGIYRTPIEIVGSWPLLEKIFQGAGVHYEARVARDVAHDAILSMAQLAADQWPCGFSSLLPEPNYLRLSTAEEQLARRAALSSRNEETR